MKVMQHKSRGGILSLIISCGSWGCSQNFLAPALLANDPTWNCCRQAVKVETHLIFQVESRHNCSSSTANLELFLNNIRWLRDFLVRQNVRIPTYYPRMHFTPLQPLHPCARVNLVWSQLLLASSSRSYWPLSEPRTLFIRGTYDNSFGLKIVRKSKLH